jgi:hypothetical protein
MVQQEKAIPQKIIEWTSISFISQGYNREGQLIQYVLQISHFQKSAVRQNVLKFKT